MHVKHLKNLSVPFSLIVPALLFLSAERAAASEWGCEVLLCAASSAPSWRGVAACQPPMQRLMSAMKKPHFSWPTCPEGGSGAPGYERYAECPHGYAIGYSEDRNGFSREPDRCVKTINVCQGNQLRSQSYDRQQSCTQTTTVARPPRSQPYYFDIQNDTTGKDERHWFELND
ncbi:hypothetical protein RMS29_026650 (plasmid) [Agrobacterium rosae]|uniref:Uncharacterized protein n=1 Tax=Agrobacterium rosae TaxID=1972867 RepID=A0ABU4W293_9HYPH|nr:hypothetical protein [Agrobacterium rosae]MDX8331866.1 hypothetical protein [Agrobacterium rosae]